ncbi:hypothetical protein CYMTET_17959 [Cymbomonas tetramitiformis]|uniref:Uncharacterized protein n=1 Tax=Cymbomonas tetramitiformis TaxID=36881 RepID=A0AAE0L6E2_9CHLO|nr:hypothetical protein CYMTET_17959 [Cymbomonas tetramitiformis]
MMNAQKMRDKRFLECNVIVVSEDITKEEVTCLALLRIVQNEKGSKKKTFFDDYTSFKWLMSSVSKAIAKPSKLVVFISHIDPSLYSLMFFKRMAHIHEKVIGPDERLEALLRERNCEALGKDSPFGFNSLYDNKEFLRLSPTQRYQGSGIKTLAEAADETGGNDDEEEEEKQEDESGGDDDKEDAGDEEEEEKGTRQRALDEDMEARANGPEWMKPWHEVSRGNPDFEGL